MSGALQIPFYLLGTATAGRYPGDGVLRALHDRELCLNTKDQILFYTNSTGALVSMPVNPTLFAMLGGAAFTVSPTAPTPAAGDNTTKLATTAFVAAIAQALAPLASPALTGIPTAPTAAALTNSTQLATTAYADRAVAAASARTPVTSGNYQAAATDRLIAYTALAAASTVTLPPPGTFPKGASILLVDEKGTATGSVTLTLAPNGSEKINGASSYVIAAAYGYVQVQTDGTNWTVIDGNAFSSSALGSSAPAMDGTAAAGSASTASRSDHVHPTDTSRAPLASPAFTGSPNGPTPAVNDASAKLATTGYVDRVQSADGRCRLSVASATSLLLSPIYGDALYIGGVQCVIPSGGVSITGQTGLTAGQLYYVYAQANAGGVVSALYLSTAGHATYTDGREYLYFNNSFQTNNRLVGAVYTNTASSPFLDSTSNRWCINWFNRRPLACSISANNSTSSTSLAAYGNSAFFLCWPDDAVGITYCGNANPQNSGAIAGGCAFVDGAAVGYSSNASAPGASSYVTMASSYTQTFSEGSHQLQNAGSVNSGSCGFATQVVATVRG